MAHYSENIALMNLQMSSKVNSELKEMEKTN